MRARARLSERYPNLAFSPHALSFDVAERFLEDMQIGGARPLVKKEDAILSYVTGSFELSTCLSLDFEKHGLYFDHKLADVFSTFTKLIALGLRDNGSGCDPVEAASFILGCRAADYKFEGTPVVADPSVYVRQFDDDATCPPTFYKGILYTFRGTPLVETAASLMRVLIKAAKPPKPKRRPMTPPHEPFPSDFPVLSFLAAPQPPAPVFPKLTSAFPRTPPDATSEPVFSIAPSLFGP